MGVIGRWSIHVPGLYLGQFRVGLSSNVFDGGCVDEGLSPLRRRYGLSRRWGPVHDGAEQTVQCHNVTKIWYEAPWLCRSTGDEMP